MSMLNLKFLRELHSIMKSVTLFYCVAMPVVYSVGLVFLIYTIDSDLLLMSYYAIRFIAGMSVVTVLCITATIGLGLYLSKRR